MVVAMGPLITSPLTCRFSRKKISPIFCLLFSLFRCTLWKEFRGIEQGLKGYWLTSIREVSLCAVNLPFNLFVFFSCFACDEWPTNCWPTCLVKSKPATCPSQLPHGTCFIKFSVYFRWAAPGLFLIYFTFFSKKYRIKTLAGFKLRSLE